MWWREDELEKEWELVSWPTTSQGPTKGPSCAQTGVEVHSRVHASIMHTPNKFVAVFENCLSKSSLRNDTKNGLCVRATFDLAHRYTHDDKLICKSLYLVTRPLQA